MAGDCPGDNAAEHLNEDGPACDFGEVLDRSLPKGSGCSEHKEAHRHRELWFPSSSLAARAAAFCSRL